MGYDYLFETETSYFWGSMEVLLGHLSTHTLNICACGYYTATN